MRWDADKIDEFLEDVRMHIVKNKHYGLIFAISSHGDGEKMMYDSGGKKYEPDCLFSMYEPSPSEIIE